ncbi:hypothetical protein [Mucilaginibacter sp. AK015]|uniref:hypothetical protein n=1 Tax=Mucilaginibacter sp. AK015 TaxID=2723072 RepID=UPI001613A05E|nr:hypothetical protein [Mucilaginibacter sp. AK015]MBB5394810.1 hypothetical protein [Mucilaginibacter sp. AK015]
MTDFRDFALVKTNELFITRHKWFFPYYELTDGQFVYGKLSYKANFKRYAVIETAEGTWTIKRKGMFNRTLLLNKGEDETIGNLVPETWKRDIAIKMDNGFEAVYMFKKVFSRSFTLTHALYGDILQIEHTAFGIKKPFEVSFDKTEQINNMPQVPLLALIGINILLIRQQHAAAAH